MKNAILLMAVGVVAGLLLAPRKGSETWKMILEKLDELKAGIPDDIEDVEEASLS